MPTINACALEDIEEEDLIRFDHGGQTYAIYRLPGDEVFCTSGLCTHENVDLSDGLVMDGIIECPRHNGRFDIRTGAAKGAPACIDLTTFRAWIENGRVMIELP